MKIATWNINSVRIRLPLIKQFVDEADPDIICLQEIKTVEETFPFQALADMGYPHAYVHGQKGYHGVAVISKIELTLKDRLHILPDGGARHISVELPGGTELHNYYIPAGGDIPDREENPYYGFKLDYIDAMREWFAKERSQDAPLILVGDFNVAPGEEDVWSHKQLLKVVSHTPPEVERLNKLQHDLNWLDVARHYTPEPEKLYSWWSYRNRDHTKHNRGRRLDHFWITQPLVASLQSCDTLVHTRSWEKPSDHVPIVVELAV